MDQVMSQKQIGACHKVAASRLECLVKARVASCCRRPTPTLPRGIWSYLFDDQGVWLDVGGVGEIGLFWDRGRAQGGLGGKGVVEIKGTRGETRIALTQALVCLWASTGGALGGALRASERAGVMSAALVREVEQAGAQVRLAQGWELSDRAGEGYPKQVLRGEHG